ncbi:putative Zinc finger, RanBP2-type [Lupinus albus]|uniref:Putative Zinc finger, RanBP2-type n=1 Tax=Lupinus albus TaxID=3870 RepID=A0A6A4Q725_LUPAL|nr:putative Zinc finger, RanBP2-type [Lupinus albus]
MSWSGGDWMCGACEHINFKKRDACQSCGYPKFGGPDPSTYQYNKSETLAGDWFCTGMNCGAHNYASRSNCYRCGALKDDYSSGYGGNMAGSGGYGSDCSLPPGWKTGDWICPRYGCGVHNYASRAECFKCKMLRDFGEKSLVCWTFH